MGGRRREISLELMEGREGAGLYLCRLCMVESVQTVHVADLVQLFC